MVHTPATPPALFLSMCIILVFFVPSTLLFNNSLLLPQYSWLAACSKRRKNGWFFTANKITTKTIISFPFFRVRRHKLFFFVWRKCQVRLTSYQRKKMPIIKSPSRTFFFSDFFFLLWRWCNASLLTNGFVMAKKSKFTKIKK